MALSVPKPTALEICDGLIAAIVADVAAVDGILLSALAPYGVTLDATTASPNDADELQFIKLSARDNLPDGLSIYLTPTDLAMSWLTAPGGAVYDLGILVEAVWVDPPAGPALTQKHRLLARMFSDFAEALAVVIGPQNLFTAGGGWSPLDDGNFVLNPMVALTTALGWDSGTDDIRDTAVPFCQLVWTAQRYNQELPD